MKIPKKFSERVSSHLKGYQGITSSHRLRDVSEADTVTVVKDMLADIFGYDKYTELTSEYQIRGTFCDLAVKIDSKVRILIEVKAAAIDLSDSHIRQAVNYGASEGIEWVALTNSIDWRLYKISFQQPVDFEQVASFKIDEVSHRKEEDLSKLFLLAREGISENALSAYHQQGLILNKYTIAQLLLSEQSVKLARKELRRLFPDLTADQEKIYDLMVNDILKREVLEGEKAKDAQARIKRAANKVAKAAAPQAASEVHFSHSASGDTGSDQSKVA